MTRQGEIMKARQAAGLCRFCGAAQAPGRSLCQPHLDQEAERKRTKDADRKAVGVCVMSGCRRRATGGHIRCRPCHARFSSQNRAWQWEHRVKGTEVG